MGGTRTAATGEPPVPDPWDDLESLCRLPHRGTCTPEEGRAARWLAARLAELGFEVDLQPFTAPRHTLYLGPGLTGLVLAALGLTGARWAGPGAGSGLLALMALVTLVPLLGELALWPGGTPISLAWVVPRGRSQNVVARWPQGTPRAAAARQPGEAGPGPSAAGLPAAGPQEPLGGRQGEPGPLHLVITAHYDTQWGSWLFAPRFLPWLQAFFVAGYAAFAAVPVLLAARAAGMVAAAPLAAAALVSAAVAGFLLLSWATGRPINGANDNGSGVAVALALARRWAARPLPGVELVVALTGAEETGMRGMAALLSHPWFPRQRGSQVAVLNIDNVGAGRLHYLTAEGMLLPVRYDARLVQEARRLAAALPAGRLTPGPRPLLPTDALVPAARRIPAITFLATGPGGRIPHYHWHTDRLEHVDRAHLAEVARVLWTYVAQLAGEPRAGRYPA
ncbi:M20/M25/M40 family metallo-hydrolase [Thermaerobacter sp. PB12/4term]|uniref:M28 family metallopeptidase n=1 Tax=Thermaerobacter sp. PB12/4term TaxID=2293838 RepID=UPI000E326590|nr:M20/M25/M40 family metallo-hydrolase [Thermaerobacter sp. PB12/4term]QIA26467.1 M20/M25/M40 family metallo-hydrolase [Thermaerobacter sp. PB12/4term]